MTPNKTKHQASFRDPSGYMFYDGPVLKRAINPIYFKQYDALTSSGFFQKLMERGLLIPHTETARSDAQIEITPEVIPFISQPYEWSFDQLKHAALLTLQLQKFALNKGFSLKDASAYNVTYHQGHPVFIDTLSFDFYQESAPWRAYKQFIMHFLSPLVLAHYHGGDMLKLPQNHIDGIPVALTASLLPLKSRLSSTLYTNIHLLAKLEAKHKDDYQEPKRVITLSKKAQLNMIEALFDYIKGLKMHQETEWGDYYGKTNYTPESFDFKKTQLARWVSMVKAKTLVDLGGNDGTFVRCILPDMDLALVADIDPNAVAQNYRQVRANKEQNMLPLWLDVLQPSPGIGLNNQERSSMIERLAGFAPDITLALALIHHVTLSGNVPFASSAAFFARFSNYLVIEFPKREDSWVQSLLLRKREFINHFDHYHQEAFEEDFSLFFSIEEQIAIPQSARVLYLMKRKNDGPHGV
jgi:hypothetical protein